MEQKPREMTKLMMRAATDNSVAKVKEYLRRADELREDSRNKDRLKAHECKGCFYFPRIGGAAMTTRACMCCHEPQMYGSTATDVLCLECAKKYSLCKRCGGDLEMRPRRRKWPKPE